MRGDPRIQAHARILVRYCIEARRGQTVGVSGTSAAEPLLEAICAELYRAGVHPFLRMTPPSLRTIFFTEGDETLFDRVPPIERDWARRIDAVIGIQSETNTRSLSGTAPERMARFNRAMNPIQEQILRKRWVTTLHPTEAYAQDAEMSLAAFEDYVYGALFVEARDPVAQWHALRRRQAALIASLKGADRIEIEGPDTRLTLSVKGRRFINSDGTRNMPSGEIFTGPVESSAEGFIRFDYPVCAHGREVAGVRLVFRHGRVVEATAEKNEAFLKEMLNLDPGARRLGELGMGTHPRLDRFVRNILFDEKIGGTVHLALGRSYPETGGRNRSALHWDLIKDLRRGGVVRVDGRPWMKEGRFVHSLGKGGA